MSRPAGAAGRGGRPGRRHLSPAETLAAAWAGARRRLVHTVAVASLGLLGVGGLAGLGGCVAVVGFATPASAQDFNQRDDKYVLLGLKRAKQVFDLAVTDLARQEDLFTRGVIPQSQLDAARRSFAEAEVNYQQSLLAVLFEDQYVAVRRAVKHRDGGGRPSVRLEIENTASSSPELRHLAGVEDELFAALAPDRIHDVYVSLLDEAGAIISQPYEAKLEELASGRPATLDFGLLRDLDAVTVALTYGNGSRREVKVFLQRDEGDNRVRVEPLQFSQEGELGGSVTYELGLELFSGADDTYRLAVLNLPPEVHASFGDPASGARLRQIRFAGEAETRRAELALELPDRPSEGLPLGRALELFVVAVPERRAGELAGLDEKRWTSEALAATGLGWARLELVARGAGKLRVNAPQLFQRVEGAQPVTIAVDLRNDGSGPLRNVELALEPPLGWSRHIEPALVPELAVGGEQRVTVTLEPPATVPAGRYESRLESRALSDGRPIDGDDKLLTVEVSAPVSLAGTASLLTLIVGIIGGLVVFGIRLTRR